MKNLVEPIKDKKQLEAIEKYLATHNKRNQLIWVFGTNTGLRVSDIIGLDIEDVEGKNQVELREKKTGKIKIFPLNSKLKRLIKEYLEGERKKYMPLEMIILYLLVRNIKDLAGRKFTDLLMTHVKSWV